ncbi:MAG TPA: restriction endonuclease [Candidatus Hydrogenedens sp.]|nr:restriction endonuclease [Candidatus Hydrogenedens sp.]HOL20174.1 restriction endonuclease [Candidatus Hydrogenedens sp.]HPP58005.1 restriction endonuclease [Candidatus Hydrogenedens sp.]
MKMMEYNEFKMILNKNIFEHSKADLLEKIANSPSRYIGLFRPTKPKGKILQNLLQSHEIRFGNAFEEVLEKYLGYMGFEILKKIYVDKNKGSNNILCIDQCFRKGKKVYFLEQKVRDDHDSSKKRGQIKNFEEKLNIMLSNFSEKELVGIFYFLDPELVKNKCYYENELEAMKSDYNIETHLFYGGEIFKFLGYPSVWNEILDYLSQWKKEIPDMPEINFDIDYENTFDEIKDLKPLIFRSLLTDDKIYNEIVCTLFPDGKTFRLLRQYFISKKNSIYERLVNLIDKRVK